MKLQPFNMLFDAGCNHKFYSIINCLLLHAGFLIFWNKTAKNISHIDMQHLVENAKQLKNELFEKKK